MNAMTLLPILHRHAERVLGRPATFELDQSFEELGIDSLYLTEMAVGVLTELDVYVPMADLATAKTPGHFVHVLLDELA